MKHELYHHGVKGQKWGIRYGPPYPLNAQTITEIYPKYRKEKLDDMNERYKGLKRELKEYFNHPNDFDEMTDVLYSECDMIRLDALSAGVNESFIKGIQNLSVRQIRQNYKRFSKMDDKLKQIIKGINQETDLARALFDSNGRFAYKFNNGKTRVELQPDIELDKDRKCQSIVDLCLSNGNTRYAWIAVNRMEPSSNTYKMLANKISVSESKDR